MKKFWKIFFASFLGCVVALVILSFLGIGILGSLMSFADKSQPAVPASSILKIDFEAPIAEQTTEQFSFDIQTGSLNTKPSMSLLSFAKAIDIAAQDPAIKFIYMTPNALNMGIAQVEEVRQALERFRSSGKAIVSYSNSLSNANYYVASVADKVILNAKADVMIFGLSSQILFLKDLLDKVGVNMQLIRHGKYKAAAEQFIQNDISEANREQNKVMLTTIWDAWCDDIAKSRDFTAEEYNKWVDEMSLTGAQAAFEKGLVDEVWYSDHVEEYLCSLYGVEKAKDLVFTSISDYAKVKVKSDMRAKDKIAILYANGEIVSGKSETGIASDTFVGMIKEIRQDSTIKALLLRVNSPGGSAQAADMIKRELQLLNETKPLIVSYGEYAASGGYWISANSDKIFSDRTTLTGSIGVFSLVPDFGKVAKKVGVNPVTISTNAHGDFGSGMRAFDAVETNFMQIQVEEIYSNFVELVAEGRNLEPAYVDEIGQGRVWAGADALKIGLVDEIGSLVDALNYTEAVTGLSKYKLVEYPVQKTGIEKLMSSLETAKASVSAMSDPVSVIESAYSNLKETSSVQTMARIPYVYDIN